MAYRVYEWRLGIREVKDRREGGTAMQLLAALNTIG